MGGISTKNEKPNHVEDIDFNLCAQAELLSRDGALNTVAYRVRQVVVAARFHVETHPAHQEVSHCLQRTRSCQKQLLQPFKTRRYGPEVFHPTRPHHLLPLLYDDF